MQAIEFEDKESFVSIAIGSALESLDLVVNPFELAGRDGMRGVVGFIREVMANLGAEVVERQDEPEPIVSCVWSPGGV